MLDSNKLKVFSEYVRDNFSEKSNELVDALDLVNMVFDEIYDDIDTKIREYLNQRNIKGSQELHPFCETILEIKDMVNEYSLLFANEENVEDEDMEEDKERKNLPDYASCVIDSTIPHTLYEDFTHTKACGFEFNGIKYDAKNMRDVMVTLCEILANEDKNKMISFIDDSTMQGRKAPYFSNKLIVEDNINKNEKVGDLDVYVWVNLSCNQIRNVIRRILKKYNYKFDDFKIYLRADYTDLHKKTNETTQENSDDSNDTEKIGKYVQSCFRQLENYHFTSNELLAMQSGEWTLKTFGFSIPLIKKYDLTKPATEQIKINGYNRYWKNPYRICGEEYFVASQWLKVHRERFNNWFKSLNLYDELQ